MELGSRSFGSVSIMECWQKPEMVMCENLRRMCREEGFITEQLLQQGTLRTSVAPLWRCPPGIKARLRLLLVRQ